MNQHLRLPRPKEFAAKLSQGVTTEQILDDVSDSVNTRIHLLTRKGIQNVERLFSLKSNQKHSDDAALWVKEMEKSDINPVLIYKPQGAT